MLLIFSLLLPVFALIFIGIFVERLHLVPQGGAAVLNQFVFNLSMPSLIFNSLAASKASELAQGGYVAGTLIGGAACFVLAQVLISRMFRRSELRREACMIGLLSAFPNAAFLGLPILLALFSNDHDAVIAGTLTAVLGLPTILIAMFLQEWFRQSGDVNRMLLLRKVSGTMLRNPILLSAVVGTIVCVAEVPMPDGVLAVFRMLAATCTPVALVALGMVLSMQMTSSMRGESHLSWQVLAHVLKLGLMPLITYAVMVLAGVPEKWIALGVLLSAMPTGSMAYVLSETYGVCNRDASQVILVNTALSMLSIPLITRLLQLGGMFPQ